MIITLVTVGLPLMQRLSTVEFCMDDCDNVVVYHIIAEFSIF